MTKDELYHKWAEKKYGVDRGLYVNGECFENVKYPSLPNPVVIGKALREAFEAGYFSRIKDENKSNWQEKPFTNEC